MTRAARHAGLACLVVTLLVALAALNPAVTFAQPAPAPDAHTLEMQAWFDGLTPQRKELLKRRLKALRRLPKDKQTELLQAAKEGRPLLTEAQRTNLRKLKEMPYLERVRLYTLARELEMLRKNAPVAYKRASEGADRDRALAEMLFLQRAQMLLTPEERAGMASLKGPERMRFLRERYEQSGRESLEELAFLEPRLADLRKAAASGDEDARRELRRAVSDLGTLNMLLQRLDKDRREKVMADLKELGLDRAMEKAVDTVRKELRAQWNEAEKRPQREDRPGEVRPGDRKALPPREERKNR